MLRQGQWQFLQNLTCKRNIMHMWATPVLIASHFITGIDSPCLKRSISTKSVAETKLYLLSRYTWRLILL